MNAAPTVTFELSSNVFLTNLSAMHDFPTEVSPSRTSLTRGTPPAPVAGDRPPLSDSLFTFDTTSEPPTFADREEEEEVDEQFPIITNTEKTLESQKRQTHVE
mmetsp:Transcript_9423/g.23940  ORF Transcript_9423/g.23940 Transcript_9423/m.23940 type:complete len:103 (+) Transcript_9423:450-758(+)